MFSFFLFCYANDKRAYGEWHQSKSCNPSNEIQFMHQKPLNSEGTHLTIVSAFAKKTFSALCSHVNAFQRGMMAWSVVPLSNRILISKSVCFTHSDIYLREKNMNPTPSHRQNDIKWTMLLWWALVLLYSFMQKCGTENDEKRSEILKKEENVCCVFDVKSWSE